MRASPGNPKNRDPILKAPGLIPNLSALNNKGFLIHLVAISAPVEANAGPIQVIGSATMSL